jgi:hypothetical protein
MTTASVSVNEVVAALAVFVSALGLGACTTSATPSVDDASTSDAMPEASALPFGDAGLDDPLSDSDASIALRMRQLVSQRCAGGPESGCHGEGAGGTHLDLSLPAGDVVGVPSRERPELLRAEPGAAERSYLWLKVAADGGIDGSVMPPSTTRDPRIEALVRRWIVEGCK